MKEQLKHILNKHPLLGRIAERLYGKRNFYLLLENIIGTKAREIEWARRHCKGDDNRWTGHCCKGEDNHNHWVVHSHRSFLLDKIADFLPFSSIMEVGCFYGVNLHLIAQRFPNIEIQGIDINPTAIRMGRRLFAKDHISNVHLVVGKADNLSKFQDKSFDVVFTDAVLLLIGQDKIQKVIREMVRVARKGLILVEWHRFEPSNKNSDSLKARYNGYWRRDYVDLLKQFVPEAKVSITKITKDIWADPNWQETGAIIEVFFGG